MIKLGSLGDYSFEGPRVLAGWSPPAVPGVFAIFYRPDAAKPDSLAVIYVGEADDLSTAGFPFKHPAASCWLKRATDRYDLLVAYYEIPEGPGGSRKHREQIVAELASVYKPGCNEQQYDVAWKAEWIGTYYTPIHSELTTRLDPEV